MKQDLSFNISTNQLFQFQSFNTRLCTFHFIFFGFIKQRTISFSFQQSNSFLCKNIFISFIILSGSKTWDLIKEIKTSLQQTNTNASKYICQNRSVHAFRQKKYSSLYYILPIERLKNIASRSGRPQELTPGEAFPGYKRHTWPRTTEKSTPVYNTCLVTNGLNFPVLKKLTHKHCMLCYSPSVWKLHPETNILKADWRFFEAHGKMLSMQKVFCDLSGWKMHFRFHMWNFFHQKLSSANANIVFKQDLNLFRYLISTDGRRESILNMAGWIDA